MVVVVCVDGKTGDTGVLSYKTIELFESPIDFLLVWVKTRFIKSEIEGNLSNINTSAKIGIISITLTGKLNTTSSAISITLLAPFGPLPSSRDLPLPVLALDSFISL